MILFCKIFYIAVLFCLFKNKLTSSTNWTEDNTVPEYSNKQNAQLYCPEEFEDFCARKYTGPDLFTIFARQNSPALSMDKNKRPSENPFSGSFNSHPCKCGMTFRLMNLGHKVYPSQIHTGVCKKNTCGLFHRCQPKKYKVRVLRKKEQDNESDSYFQDSFPESLKDEWIPGFVDIVVGCECQPKKMK